MESSEGGWGILRDLAGALAVAADMVSWLSGRDRARLKHVPPYGWGIEALRHFRRREPGRFACSAVQSDGGVYFAYSARTFRPPTQYKVLLVMSSVGFLALTTYLSATTLRAMITRQEILEVGRERAGQVEALVLADPTIGAAEIARQVGVSRQRALQILDGLGYELAWRKRRGKVARSSAP